MQLRMAGIMESGPGLLHIRRCHGVVERTQGEPTYVTVWLGEVGRGGWGVSHLRTDSAARFLTPAEYATDIVSTLPQAMPCAGSS